jgi:glutathione S-transferase
MLTLYGMSDSGNCYKIKLALAQLEIDHKWIEVDPLKGETRTRAFLAKNPNGKVPVLELDDGSYLPESNAILNYLADGTALLPGAPLARARVLQWMFFEQYSHEPYVGVARSILRYDPPDSRSRAELPRLHELGNHALGVMEQHLADTPFFVGGRYSIADIALYGYTHCAADGGFDLKAYPAIGDWLMLMRAQPNFVPMHPSPP